MIKRILLGFLLLISGFFFLFNKTKIVNSEDLAVYVNDELVSSIPKKGEATFIKAVCDNDGKASWDNDNWGLIVTNMSKKTKCNLYFYEGQTVFDFDYTGSEQVFTVPVSGTYKLETWGAQGGSSVLNGENIENRFYGGYSEGIINLKNQNKLFISIGGKGEDAVVKKTSAGGYNGGGSGDWDHFDDESCGGGGGATSIQNALIGDGQLKNYENNKGNVLIVSGGSAGMGATLRDTLNSYRFSNGGGFIGGKLGVYDESTETYKQINKITNQIIGYKFGVGASATDITVSVNQEVPGAGGGWYGGYTLTNDDIQLGVWSFSGGGSGYIGNPLLKEKAMYCYNCEESNDESTKTISTTCSEETPTSNCAKKGNGYARITLISIEE